MRSKSWDDAQGRYVYIDDVPPDNSKSPLVVTVDKEGAGGYVADYNSSDILAAAQAHRAVIMRYTDTDSGLQTDILLKGQSGGLPLFYDTWLSKDKTAINRIDATVDYSKNVTVTQSSVPAIPAGGTVSQFLVSDGAGGVKWETIPAAKGVGF